MAGGDEAAVRSSSSKPRIDPATKNITNPLHPLPTYRLWNLWGYPDNVLGIYA
jgi:hypothetical protein